MRTSLVLTCAVLCASAVAAPATAAKKLPACPVVADDTGDVTPPDASFDITSVTYAKAGKTLAVTIAVDGLAENVATSWGDRFMAVFGADDKAVEVYYKRSRTRNEEANVFYQQGLRVNGTFVSDAGISARYDVDKSTVTITITLAALKAGVGKSVDGAEITNLGAAAQRSFIGVNQPADVATSEQAFRVAECAVRK